MTLGAEDTVAGKVEVLENMALDMSVYYKPQF